MPRWWVWTFYATIVWALGYTIAYPAWPLMTGPRQKACSAIPAAPKSSSEIAAAQARRADLCRRDRGKADRRDPRRRRRFAASRVAGGRRGLQGQLRPVPRFGRAGLARAIPNLNDDDWLWGGNARPDPADDRTRHPLRRAMAKRATPICRPSATILEPTQITAGQQLSSPACQTPVADRAACRTGQHASSPTTAPPAMATTAKGNRELGAPDLTDAIWLYGSGEAAIAAQVRRPEAWRHAGLGGRLGDTTVKELAVYVHSLGGGE